jgi:hypothetical protein
MNILLVSLHQAFVLSGSFYERCYGAHWGYSQVHRHQSYAVVGDSNCWYDQLLGANLFAATLPGKEQVQVLLAFVQH